MDILNKFYFYGNNILHTKYINVIHIFYYIFIFYLVIMVTFNFTIFCNIKSTNIFYPFSFGIATAAFFIFKKINILNQFNQLNIGETYFNDGTTVSPDNGRLLMFDGKKYPHGVNQVLLGERYVLPIWYKQK